MNHYSAIPQGQIWHVLKDGKFFCIASSQSAAEKICASLEGGKTPSVQEFKFSQIGQPKPARTSSVLPGSDTPTRLRMTPAKLLTPEQDSSQ